VSTVLIYISGKITGLEDLNKPKFGAAEDLLKWAMLEFYGTEKCPGPHNNTHIILPHDLPDEHDKNWESYMRECLKCLAVCNLMYVLDDWKDSKGALVEVFFAKVLKIPVREIETLEPLKIGYAELFLRLLKMIK
jgi:hypothetical protein